MSDEQAGRIDILPEVPGAAGADLYWWVRRPAQHTLITIWGGAWAPFLAVEEVRLEFRLHDGHGRQVAAWTWAMGAKETLFLDSRHVAALPEPAQALTEGLLAVWVVPPSGSTPRLPYRRIYALVDYFGPDGLMSLHSDQVIELGRVARDELTEIVFDEGERHQTSLLLLNGPTLQRSGALTLSVTNAAGGTRSATYDQAIAPYSVHRIALREVFPELVEFGGGDPISLSGTYDCRDVFVRPYVLTVQGGSLCGYHAGDRYCDWVGVPAKVYAFMGRGETNPMVAVYRPDLTTTVNLLHSHGTVEEDFWVDAQLYDSEGELIATRSRWLLARRHGLSRGDVRELLPEPEQPFQGYICLSFSPRECEFYPRRLQALMEYRAPASTSRVMAWSDVWNDVVRARHARARLCYYRAWWGDGLETWLALTNHGAERGYAKSVDLRVRLEGATGFSAVWEGRIEANATLFQPVTALFPELPQAARPYGLVVVESEGDLACVQLTRHHAAGVWSAEHFMAAATVEGSHLHFPCGA